MANLLLCKVGTKEQEENYMHIMAELEENGSFDKGEIEISDSKKYQP